MKCHKQTNFLGLKEFAAYVVCTSYAYIFSFTAWQVGASMRPAAALKNMKRTSLWWGWVWCSGLQKYRKSATHADSKYKIIHCNSPSLGSTPFTVQAISYCQSAPWQSLVKHEGRANTIIAIAGRCAAGTGYLSSGDIHICIWVSRFYSSDCFDPILAGTWSVPYWWCNIQDLVVDPTSQCPFFTRVCAPKSHLRRWDTCTLCCDGYI